MKKTLFRNLALAELPGGVGSVEVELWRWRWSWGNGWVRPGWAIGWQPGLGLAGLVSAGGGQGQIFKKRFLIFFNFFNFFNFSHHSSLVGSRFH